MSADSAGGIPSFWLLWNISKATPTAVFCNAICGLLRHSVSCHMLAHNHCVLPDFYPLSMEIPILWLFSHQIALITLLTLWVWAFQTDVSQSHSSRELVEDCSNTVLCQNIHPSLQERLEVHAGALALGNFK